MKLHQGQGTGRRPYVYRPVRRLGQGCYREDGEEVSTSTRVIGGLSQKGNPRV